MRNKQLYRKLKKKFGKRKADLIMMSSRRKQKGSYDKSLQAFQQAIKELANGINRILSEFNKLNKVDSDWEARLEMDSIE